jgi:transposase InsO family protein
VGHRRIRRKLGLCAMRPKRRTSTSHPERKIYPYLLRDKTIDQPNQVWSADITYIPMRWGFPYLLRSSIGRQGVSVVASVEHPDGGVLRCVSRRSSCPILQAWHLQYRSGVAVHQ